MRILIVKRDKLGDMLLTIPLIQHLKRSLAGSEIHVLASDYGGWVLGECPEVSRVWTYPRLRASALLKPASLLRYLRTHRAVRRERFDVVIAAGGEFSRRAIEKALAVKGARTIAYVPDARSFAGRLSDPLPAPMGGHEIDRMLGLASPLGLALPKEPASPEFVPPKRACEFARAWLAERGLQERGYVVLGLGARRAARQPDQAQILRWSAYWRDRHGLATVFMWTPGGAGNSQYPGDDSIAQTVLDAARGQRPDIHAFRGPVVEALGLIWLARTSVFPDSGLMHFAAASPGGVLGLFAGPDLGPAPDQWAPRGRNAAWLRAAAQIPDLPDAEFLAAIDRLLERV